MKTPAAAVVYGTTRGRAFTRTRRCVTAEPPRAAAEAAVTRVFSECRRLLAAT